MDRAINVRSGGDARGARWSANFRAAVINRSGAYSAASSSCVLVAETR